MRGPRRNDSTGRVFAAIAFVDIVRSTELATRLGDRAWRDLLDAFHEAVYMAIWTEGGERVNTIGDGVFAAFSTASAAVRWSQAVHHEAQALDVVVRVGVHASEVERRGRDLAGIGIHVAARVASVAPPGSSVVTSTVRDLVEGSKIELADHGDHDLPGIARPWRLFAVPAERGGVAADPPRRDGRAVDPGPLLSIHLVGDHELVTAEAGHRVGAANGA